MSQYFVTLENFSHEYITQTSWSVIRVSVKSDLLLGWQKAISVSKQSAHKDN